MLFISLESLENLIICTEFNDDADANPFSVLVRKKRTLLKIEHRLTKFPISRILISFYLAMLKSLLILESCIQC